MRSLGGNAAGPFERFTPGYVTNRLRAAMMLEGLIASNEMDVMSGSGYFNYGEMKPDEFSGTGVSGC